uniref:Uncharacterized protein n=1 Tax=viral metagenome TaxID=1070528 RepID=A0A6C0LC20_9ZZZZ
MTDYSRMRGEDMKLFVFEWIILHPEEGKGIKYVRNLNKAELRKACLFIDGKMSKEEFMEEVIFPKKLYFSETAKQRYLKNKGEGNKEDDDDEDDDKEDDDDEDENKEDDDDEDDDDDKNDEDDDKDDDDDE